jgi:uncharacterized membrane protein YGL010W
MEFWLMQYLVALLLGGAVFPALLARLGYLTGQPGVDYYAEVHTTALNSYTHSLFMPFAMYGMLLWIPAVLRLTPLGAVRLDKCIYAAFMAHYLTIDVAVGLLVCAFYYAPLVCACATHRRASTTTALCVGLGVSVFALVVQEGLGHWYSGDPPSRSEGVFNAILYAMYYSVSHFGQWKS